MNRWKASGIHFAISATIGAVIAVLLFFLWYPQPYFHAAGADGLVLLLVGVDVVLGPLLTAIVFKQGKKGLKFDLTVITLTQAFALFYGMSVVLRSRPVFICGYISRFSLVSAYEIDPADLAKATRPEFRYLSWTGPRLAGARMPTDPNARNKVISAAVSGRDLYTFPQYYENYSDVAAGLLKTAKPLSQLRSSGQQVTQVLDQWLSTHAKSEQEVVWLPLIAAHGQLTMLMDATNGQPLDAVAINPFGK